MTTAPYSEPLPGDPLGIRLCETFPYVWKAILRPNDPDGQWETLDKYPLKPRVLWRYWQDAAAIVGTRFGTKTKYGLIDIDAKSDHPQQNPHSLDTIRAALETIGICRTVLTRSSFSGGLHLWLPLPTIVPSFWFATTLKLCLEQHGFELKQGQLETFPNCKRYSPKGQTPSEYQGHRLPLQPASGAALLNTDAQVVPGELGAFFQQWDVAAAAQDASLLTVNVALVRELQTKRRYCSTHKAIKEWRADLETEINEGWTGHGQTNHLLKTIACYGVVFAGQSQEELVDYIVRTAIALPGYQEWCGHKAHIDQRARDWAKSADRYYWAIGTEGCRTGVFHQHKPTNNIVKLNQNQQRAADARARIQAAVEQLEAAHSLPDGVRDRMAALAQTAKCSNQTLRKVQELWHPYRLQSNSQAQNSLEEALSGGACNSDGESDRGEKCPLQPRPPKPGNTDGIDVRHTLTPIMKGVMVPEVSSGKALETASLGANRFAKTESVTVETAQVMAEGADGKLPESFPQGATVTPKTPARSLEAPTTSLPPAAVAAPPAETTSPLIEAPTPPAESSAPLEAVETPPTETAPQPIPKEERVMPLPLLTDTPVECGKGQDVESGTHSSEATESAGGGSPGAETGSAPATVKRPRRHRRTIPLAEQVLPHNAQLIAPEPVYPEIAPDEVVTITDAIGRVVQQLQQMYGWTAEHLAIWLAQEFGGRRRHQIVDRELPVLFERLQTHYQSLRGTGSGDRTPLRLDDAGGCCLHQTESVGKALQRQLLRATIATRKGSGRTIDEQIIHFTLRA